MGRTFVVTAGKGGVGKTTVSANLGASLAILGRKVIVVDMDIGLRNLDIVMGLENRVVYNMMDVIHERCKINQALVKDKHINSLFLLPASQIHTKDDIEIDRVVDIMTALNSAFDYVILDSPAGIEKGFKSSIAPASEAIVVATPDVSSVRDADRVIGLMENNGIQDIYLVINRYDISLVRKRKMLDYESILDILGVELLGIIPEDKAVIDSTNRGEILVNYDQKAPASKAFEEISKRIEGEEIPLNTYSRKGIFRLFRREESA